MPKDFGDLIEIQHYNTYRYARIIDDLVRNPMVYARVLNEMLDEGGNFEFFCTPFRKVSALHNFASIVLDSIFDRDLSNGVHLVASGSQVFFEAPPYDREMFVLPFENAFEALGIPHTTFVEFRSNCGLPALEPGFDRHLSHAERNPCDRCLDYTSLADAYNDYFNEFRLTGELEVLCDRLAEEVFFVLFANRSFLYEFNQLMAVHVTSVNTFADPGEVDPESIFTSRKDGLSRLRRVEIPEWVKTAVEFRERGRCANCKIELGTLRTPIKKAEFDHMVPLAEGGLNDVTNIQLLCHVCNNEKRAKVIPPRALYERWYPV